MGIKLQTSILHWWYVVDFTSFDYGKTRLLLIFKCLHVHVLCTLGHKAQPVSRTLLSCQAKNILAPDSVGWGTIHINL